MIEIGLTPREPVRYYLAYMEERRLAQEREERENADKDIQVMD